LLELSLFSQVVTKVANVVAAGIDYLASSLLASGHDQNKAEDTA
jgi:hypothetical protein